MTGLEQHFIRLIESRGPISLAQYMEDCLGHPEFGYYMTRDPFGVEGDFITGPEVSQMFGELIGLWLASEWKRMGAPNPVRLVELGPGRGTLMSDAIQSLRKATEMLRAIDLHMVETSPILKAKQDEKFHATWHNSIDTIPGGPTLLIANEFFDALPIQQFQKTADGWRERMIGVKNGKLNTCFGPIVTPPLPHEPQILERAPLNSVAETSPTIRIIAEALGRRIRDDGGAGIIIDYGYKRHALGDTLQAVRGHKPKKLLDKPGETDLTAHVDFEALGKAFEKGGARVYGPVDQGGFLRLLGIGIRAVQLKARATKAQRASIDAALERLVSPAQMGSLFKVMAVTRGAAAPPIGF